MTNDTTTAAPNNTTLPGEVSSVVPDEGVNTTTAAPNNTTLSGEVSSVVPDASETAPAEKPSTATVQSPNVYMDGVLMADSAIGDHRQRRSGNCT